MSFERVEERAAVERRRQDGVDAQSRPVALGAGFGHGERGAAGGVGGVDQVPVEADGPGVDEQGGVGPGGGQPGADLLGAHAADEVGGHRTRSGPATQLREPGGAGVGQAEQRIAGRRHQELRWAVGAAGSPGRW